MKVLADLIEQRDKVDAELGEITERLKAEGQDDKPREPTAEEEKRTNELLGDLDDLDARIRDEKKIAKRTKTLAEARSLVAGAAEVRSDGTSSAKVTAEPMVYGEGSDHSYVADLCRYRMGAMWGGVDPGTAERMATWEHQVEREVAEDSQKGRDALKQIRNMQGVRTENGNHARKLLDEVRSRGRVAADAKQAEIRTGITTGGGATASAAGGGGAALVTPWFTPDYAPYREAGRPFADLCNKQDLPPYGLNVYMPAVTGPAAVASQTEGAAVTETDPTLGFRSAGIITEAGQVIITQQLLDRAGPNFSFDKLIFDQLRRDLAPKIDTYVLTQALSGATGITFTSASWAFVAAPGTASFVSKVAGAINSIETTAGTVMSPNVAIAQPSRWNFLESVGALEASGALHPMLVPNQNGPFNAFIAGNQDGKVPYEGYTGYQMFGLPIFKDLNIPAPGTGADQFVVANSQVINVYEGPQVPRVVPQTYANNLQALLQLYEYVAVLVVYPAAVATISGTGMGTITF